MFSHKNKPNQIINSSLQLFPILCFIGTMYLGIFISYWYFLFLTTLPFSIRWIKPNRKQIMVMLLILLPFIFLFIFANQFSLVEVINQWFKDIGAKQLRNLLFKFFDKSYSKEISAFIKLILFNVKSKETIIFLEQIVDLGIVWLFCVSGFHISLLSRLIKKIFKKKWRIGKWVDLIVLIFYSYFLNFSYASIRVILFVALDGFFLKYQISKLNKLGCVGLIVALFNPSCFASYSFMLAFIVCISCYFVIDLKFNNKIVRSLLINVCAFIVTIPFVIDMNNKISLFSFINAFIFSYVSRFVFLYFLVFACAPFMSVIHWGIMSGCFVIVGNISFGNIFIYSQPWEAWGKFLYFFSAIALSKGLYLIVNNNKI